MADQISEAVERVRAALSASEGVDSVGTMYRNADIKALLAERDRLAEALEEAASQLHRIMRNAEMSSGIMLDPERTGHWAGARKTADAFDRIGLRAAEAKASARAALAQFDGGGK